MVAVNATCIFSAVIGAGHEGADEWKYDLTAMCMSRADKWHGRRRVYEFSGLCTRRTLTPVKPPNA